MPNFVSVCLLFIEAKNSRSILINLKYIRHMQVYFEILMVDFRDLKFIIPILHRTTYQKLDYMSGSMIHKNEAAAEN